MSASSIYLMHGYIWISESNCWSCQLPSQLVINQMCTYTDTICHTPNWVKTLGQIKMENEHFEEERSLTLLKSIKIKKGTRWVYPTSWSPGCPWSLLESSLEQLTFLDGIHQEKKKITNSNPHQAHMHKLTNIIYNKLHDHDLQSMSTKWNPCL